MKSFIYKKKGMAMPIAIIIGIIILATSITLLSLVDNSIRMRKVSEDKIAARYAAEAGIQEGLYKYDLKIKELNDDKNTREKNKKEKIVNKFDGEGKIENNSEKSLGRYKFEYTPPNIEENENKGVIEAKGITNGAEVNIKVEFDINDGSILSRKEQ